MYSSNVMPQHASSVRYALQVPNAIVFADSVRYMEKNEIDEFRRRRMQQAIDTHFDGNETAFGRSVGYKDGAFVRQMLAADKAITEKTVAKIEKAIPKLYGWFAVEPSNVDLGPDLKAFRAVPNVGEVKGGQDGYFEELQYPTGHGDGVIDYPTTDRNAYALRVRGDSMHPRYRAGEYIVVEPSIEPQPGEDVVVICRDGRKLLKTLAWTRGGSISLLSINNGHSPLTLDLTEIERMHTVAGVVPARALRKLAGSSSPSSSGSPQTSGAGPWAW